VLLWSFSSVIPLKVHYTEFVPSAEVSTSLLLPTETPRSFPAGQARCSNYRSDRNEGQY
jgi:hypothetical protein